MDIKDAPRFGVDRPALLAGLARILPADALLADEEQLRPYECDGLTAYRQLPLAVAIPRTEDEVRAAQRQLKER